ncbi:uncharacterized protein ARMOST_11538 [Armillaria ostoyae]|uniref:Uncharacterized protein n=1 Tax=Armillaria ostoyae TaxID=47428 RepID=A0A284RHE4_ARMOS|nr:uncharacterized protein ARMOST_11538 [Armillaria ostoyae]
MPASPPSSSSSSFNGIPAVMKGASSCQSNVSSPGEWMTQAGEGARRDAYSLQPNMHSAGDVQVPILPAPSRCSSSGDECIRDEVGRGCDGLSTSRRMAVLTDNGIDGTPVTECIIANNLRRTGLRPKPK